MKLEQLSLVNQRANVYYAFQCPSCGGQVTLTLEINSAYEDKDSDFFTITKSHSGTDCSFDLQEFYVHSKQLFRDLKTFGKYNPAQIELPLVEM